jgi:hypothetical protein
VVPEGATVRDVREREDLLHAAVAVSCDDEDAAGKGRRCGVREAEDDVAVELALRPVRDQVVAAEAACHFVEKDA